MFMQATSKMMIGIGFFIAAVILRTLSLVLPSFDDYGK